ncbi:BppU family phage baseplate upper protein, partial [Listeria monocytogenes]|uniref:BppU family phage baseplate upper protein n=1 Tax=Listeria monocytogenes TaxID=1639 RepID=UPI003204ADF3
MAKRYITIVLVYLLLLFSASVGIPIVQHILLSTTSLSAESAASYGMVIWSIFSTQDSGGTARLKFTAKKDDNNLPLSSAAEVTLAMVLSVGKKYESSYIVNPEIINRTEGVFEYSLTDEQISHDGQANAE